MAPGSRPIGCLGDHAGRYRIWLNCRCGHGTRFDAEILAARLGREFPNWRLVARARCQRCGARSCGMTLEPIGAHGYVAEGPGARAAPGP